MVETNGLVGSIEALDAMTKAAEMGLAWREAVGGSLFAIFVRGSVGGRERRNRPGSAGCRRCEGASNGACDPQA